MARKPIARDDRKALFDGEPNLVRIDVEGAARLMTFDSDDTFWTRHDAHITNNVRGAIVRLRPPHDFPADDLSRARQWCVESGAIAVRLLPVRRSAVVPQAARTPAQKRGAREVALELVAASSHSDKDALRARVEDRLTLVGL